MKRGEGRCGMNKVKEEIVPFMFHYSSFFFFLDIFYQETNNVSR